MKTICNFEEIAIFTNESVIKAVLAEADGTDNTAPSTAEAPVREKAGTLEKIIVRN